MKTLVLGGTAEARALADRIGSDAIYSLAGRTSEPRVPLCEVRVGPFGGADGLLTYLREHAVDALIDATHPFADQMPLHAAEACRTAGVPRLKLVRPPWQPMPGDRWSFVADVAAAAGALTDCNRVFLAIGIQELCAFAEIVDALFLVRTVETPMGPLPLRTYKHVAGRGPFSLADERELLARHQIDTIVCKNSGGEGAYAKIAAARELGLRVIMIERPAQPEGSTVATIEEAVVWLEQVRRLRGGDNRAR